MNKLTVIGRLTKDPDLRATSSGDKVCSFTVAVDRRGKKQEGRQNADFFNVSAWRVLGENCHKYLSKGKMVCVIGPVSVRTYQANDGSTRAVMEVQADEVEFLSPKGEGAPAGQQEAQEAAPAASGGFTQVEMDGDDLPF